MKKKRDLNQEKKILKPHLQPLESAGIRIRIERGDFKSGYCLVNEEYVIFLNRSLQIEDQIKLIDSFKEEDQIKERLVHVKQEVIT